MELCDRFQLCHTSVTSGMVDLLAAELGVLPEAIVQLGVGYDYQYQAWVFAERNARGDIIGLSYRYESGKKTMAPGLKHNRGLVYPFNHEFDKGVKRYAPGRHNWVRIADAGVCCPVCGKPDGCLVSADNPADPAACICIRPSAKEGATADLGEAGSLCILKKEGKVKSGPGVLVFNELPVLIVEGASDVLAALSLGFAGVGRPAAHAGMEILSQMPLSGREVWIIGENDAGAGREGMEKAFAVVSKMTPVVRKVMPPEGIKDLRAWYRAGLTKEAFEEYVKNNTESQIQDPNIFEDGQPTTFGRLFLDNLHHTGDAYSLRSFREEFYEWNEGAYLPKPESLVRGELYEYLDGKSYTKETSNGTAIVPIPMTRRLIGDVIDTLNMPGLCPVIGNPPCWLTRKGQPDPKNLIAFRNGVLDVAEYMAGRVTLYPPDPDLFIFSTFPYEYDPEAQSKLAMDYLNQIFNGDRETIRLIRQWFGYNLVPDTSAEKMMLFIGRPRSGKGTTMDMLRAMLGTDQCCSLQMSSLSAQFGRVAMLGKLAAIFGDAKTPRASETGAALENLLRIIGRDAVSVDRKFQSELPNVELFCRFTMGANDLPSFSDHARALVARMLIARFPNSYVGREDWTLKDRMTNEARSGKLINWALEGLKDLRSHKRFVEPVSSIDLMNKFELETNPIMAFVQECCDRKPQLSASKNELYKAWSNWCREQGRPSDSREMFGRRLLNSLPDTRITRASGERRAGAILHRIGPYKRSEVQLPMTMRRWLVVAMVLPYIGLCIYDLMGGRPRTGVSAGLLAVVNFILYWS